MQHANQPLLRFAALSLVTTVGVSPGCSLPDADVGELGSSSTPAGSDADLDGDDGDAVDTGAGASGPLAESGDGNGTSGSDTNGSNDGTTGRGDDNVATDDGETDLGSESDGVAESTGADGSPQDACCVEPLLSWGFVGSILPHSTESQLDDCDAFVRFDDNDTMDDTPPVACPSQLACLTDAAGIGTSHVNSFLLDAQFQAVIAEGSEFYGVNSAPIDIPNFHFVLDDVDIGIGGMPCTMPSDGPLSCTPVPPIVAEFADLLQALTVQQAEACPQ